MQQHDFLTQLKEIGDRYLHPVFLYIRVDVLSRGYLGADEKESSLEAEYTLESKEGNSEIRNIVKLLHSTGLRLTFEPARNALRTKEKQGPLS
jgi:hypothetical protein